MSPAPSPSLLEQLERQAHERGLLLRLQVGRPLGLWTLRLVVASPGPSGTAHLLGEMKGWAYAAKAGLQLDTMRVQPGAPAGVGDLIWAATMAWALEATPCRRARLLAIRDAEQQHRRLHVPHRFEAPLTEVADQAAAWDLPLRMVWGGAGALMCGDVEAVLERSRRGWHQSAA